MRRYVIEFSDRETLPDQLEALAAALGLTPEQFIIRCITRGIVAFDPNRSPSVPGNDMEDFLIKNGALKRHENKLE